MKKIEKFNHELLRYLKEKGFSANDMQSCMAKFIFLGYYTSCYSSEKLIDRILNSYDIEEEMKIVFDSIENDIPVLKGVFKALENNNLLKDDINKILVALKSSFFDAKDYKLAFENMIENTVDSFKRSKEESSTPDCINKLAVKIIEPLKGEFYDGTIGIAGDALCAYNFATRNNSHIKIFGQESNSRVWAIANIRMVINRIKNFDIKLGDTLTNPLFLEDENMLKKFDSIIMNPPFTTSLGKEEIDIISNDKYSRFIYGSPFKNNLDWMFISSAIKSLKKNGKAVVVTSLGSLFRSGIEEKLRYNFLGFDYIESIISLPARLFNYTGIPCALMVLNMDKPHELKNKIQFINADDIHETSKKGRNILSEKNINYILDIYKNKIELEDISKIVKLRDIEEANILPSKYVSKTEIDTNEFGKVKIHLEKLSGAKELGDIAEFYRGINIISKDVQDDNGKYKIINFADIKDGEIDIDSLQKFKIESKAKIEAYKVEAGDIIISSRGATKVCVIPEHKEEILISQNFIGIRLNPGYDPEYIKKFLESPLGEYLIESRKSGTALATINPKDIREIPIITIDSEEQKRIIEEYKKSQESIENEIKKLESKLNKLKLELYEKMNIKDTFEIM